MWILNEDSFFPISSPVRKTWEDTYVMTKWAVEMLREPGSGVSALLCQRQGKRKMGAERGGDGHCKLVARPWIGSYTRQVILFLLYRNKQPFIGKAALGSRARQPDFRPISFHCLKTYWRPV